MKTIGYLSNSGKVCKTKAGRTQSNKAQFKKDVQELCNQKGWKFGKL